MANELNFAGDPASDSGLTVTSKVYSIAGVQTGGTISMTEVGTLAIYRGDMPTSAAGEYIVRYFNSTTLLGSESLFWDGSAPITLGTIGATGLTAQATRDAMSLQSTDGKAGIDARLSNIEARAGRV